MVGKIDPRQRPMAWGAGGLLLAVIAGVAWLLWPAAPRDPWKPTTVPRTAECGPGCKVIGEFDTAHGPRIRVTEQPAVDDPVAQWADCMTSIRTCAEREGRDAFAGCVAKSACPRLCKDDFRRRTGTTPDVPRLRASFEATFLADDAPCLPRVERSQTRGGGSR